MEHSRILWDVIELEKRIAGLYTDAARTASDTGVAKVLGMLSKESHLHAHRLASRHGLVVPSQSESNEGVEEIVRSLEDRVVRLGGSNDLVEVIHEGIEIEKRMEELYQDVSRTLRERGEEKASKVVWQIAIEEEEHQRVLSKAYEALLFNKEGPSPDNSGYAWTALEGAGRAKSPGRSVRRFPSRRRRRPRRTGTSFKAYLSLAVLCFAVAAVVMFVTGEGPKMVLSAIKGQVRAVIAEEKERVEEELAKELSDTDLDDLVKRYNK